MSRWYDTDATDVFISYDDRGRTLSTRTRSGHYEDRFVYNDAERHNCYLDAEGGTTHYWYNEDGLVTRSIDPLGRESYFEWELSNLVARTDALGRTTVYQRNAFGDIEQVDHYSGDIWRYSYDGYGQVTEIVLPAGEQWQLTYNENGHLLQVVDPQGRQTEYRYGVRGEVLRQILPGGAQWRYDYDTCGCLKQVENPGGDITQLSQDLLGRVTTVRDALGFETKYTHHSGHASPAGSISEIHLPDGVQQHIAWTSEHLPGELTDGEGKRTRYEYGAFDLLLRMERPDGQVLRFDYDRLTRLTAVTSAAGETYRYIRDAAGQVIEERDFVGRVMRYEYDAVGRRIRAWLPGGQVTTWHYGKDNDRLTGQRNWHCTEACSHLIGAIDYIYDGSGRPVTVTSDDAVVEFDYDGIGQVIAERINGRSVSYQYDASGQRTVTRLDGVALHLDYNALGAVSQFSVKGHAPLSLGYNARGEEQWRESGAGFALLRTIRRRDCWQVRKAGGFFD